VKNELEMCECELNNTHASNTSFKLKVPSMCSGGAGVDGIKADSGNMYGSRGEESDPGPVEKYLS
jgi:hypothetical protein